MYFGENFFFFLEIVVFSPYTGLKMANTLIEFLFLSTLCDLFHVCGSMVVW
jgi:hypothetical protein